MIRLRGGERGASAVEFALIISLLFVILFGIIQFGIAYNRYQGINAGAREGARLASLKDTQVDSIQDRVLESLSILNECNFYSTPGNCSSPRMYTCPLTLGVETGCVEVAQEVIGSPGTYTTLTSGTAQACDTPHQNLTVRVDVKYRMRITIPLWASPAVTARGTGIFRCE